MHIRTVLDRRSRSSFRVVILSAIFIASCTASSVERQRLFSIQIGRSEDQLNLVQNKEQPFRNEIDLAIRGGFVYVSDASANKIMQFSSYGELLMLLYDDRTNPKPVLLSGATVEGVVSNRNAYRHHFEGIGGHIAVSGDGMIYIEDAAPESLLAHDESLDANLRFIVRQFSPGGKDLGHLGREGSGGTPFPLIQKLIATRDGSLVVISRTRSEWLAYSFDSAGKRLYEIRVDPSELPLSEEASVVSIGSLLPDRRSELLYLKADYYQDRTRDVEFVESRIIMLNPAGIVGNIRLPKVYLEQNPSSESEVEVLYEFLGAAADGRLFSLASVARNRYSLLVVDRTGAVTHREIVELPDEETLMRKIFLSDDGLLAILSARPLEAQIDVWRYDEIVGGDSDETR